MPVQQIAVVPLRETAINGKSARRSKEKSEGVKTPGKSGIRSSNISKASNSSALGAASRTAVTPSPQDICSSGQLTRLDGNASAINKPTSKHTGPGVAADGSSTLGSSSQAKRRHRRQRDSCGAVHCVDTGAKGDRTALAERSPSTDRSEREENRAERPPKARRERALPPRLRKLTARESDTTSEEEGGRREARSWSKEKARRGRRRSGSSRERDGVTEVRAGGDNGETMELQSVGSDEGEKKNPAWMESEVGPKRRRSVGGSLTTNGGGGSQREGSQGNEKKLGGYKSLSHGGSSLAEEGEELITKLYQEKGSGVGDMSVSTPREHCCVNGGTVQLCSDDSEMEVCRICHCGREEECPLITPCWCTGSLGFVHQACLNQWILSSDTRCCELCKYDFIMETQLKPIRKWEKLNMSKGERRKIFCSVLFHLFAIACVLWSVCVLVKRTVEEVRLGRNGVVEWPFWTKLIVVAVGLMGGLIFMYIQCNVYLQLWRRLKAFNRIITVQNCPEKGLSSSRAVPSTLANGKLQAVDPPPVPIPEADSDLSVEAAVAPAKNPV